MPQLTIDNGITWNYDLDGKGAVLLFIHGWGVDHRIWRQQTKYFSRDYQVIAVDLPGHGESTWEKISLAQMAGSLHQLINHLGVKDISVVGSSLGGLLGLKLYTCCPENIKRFVFIGCMPKFSQSEDYPYGLDVQEMRKLGDQLNKAYPSMVNIFFRSLFTKEERSGRRFKWLQKFKQTDDAPIKDALVEYLDILEQEDLRDVLKSVIVPVYFINGREDHICDSKTVKYLRSVRPESQFRFFENCGHFPFLSKPHEFNKVLEEYLNNDA